MRRICLVLAISAAIGIATASPATAQSEDPTLGCIPTSDTPFQTGLTGPLPFASSLILYGEIPGLPPFIFGFSDVSPDGFAVFPSGLGPALYSVAFVDRELSVQPLGTIQIGNCTPTSKEQCTDGGWRGFDYKNKGQCIAFVNRGEGPQQP